MQPPAYAPLTDDPRLHPGRAARVQAGDELAGRVGEVHPAVIEALDLRTPRILVAELAIAGLSGGQPSVPKATTPPRHPAVERDLAVIVAADAAAADVEASIRRHGGPLLRSAALFDIYRGRPLAEGEKCLAYRLAVPGRRPDAGRIRGRGGGGDGHRGLASDVGGRLRA